MATHHVHLRRLCANSLDVDSIARRARLKKETALAQAERTPSNSAHAFTQASELAWNSPKHDWFGKVQVSYQVILAHRRDDGKEGAKARSRVTARDTSRWLAAG
jgi:hypothetical protein